MAFAIMDGRNRFWQWDLGQKLVVYDDTCGQVHFCNGTTECALITKIYTLEDGTRVADVPNILLQTAKPFTAYLYHVDADSQETMQARRFEVAARSKPEDYVYEETELFGYTVLDGKITSLEATKIPTSADVDDSGLVAFKNSRGVTLFTLDLAGLGGDAYFGNLIISAETLEIAEGGSGTFEVYLETAPSHNQPVYLAVSDNTRLSVSPSTLTFTPTNYATPQIVTVTAAQDEDEQDESITVTLTSRKVDPKQLLVSIVDDDKYVPWGGKEVVSQILSANVTQDDSGNWNAYDSATGQTLVTVSQYAYYWPLKTGVTGTNLRGTDSIAGERIAANTTGAYSIIYECTAAMNQDNSVLTGMSLVVENSFSDAARWDGISCYCGAKYKKSDGTVADVTINTKDTLALWPDIPTKAKGWTKRYTTAVFNADGTINLYSGDVLVYSNPAPEDFAGWTFAHDDWGWSTLRVTDISVIEQLIIINDAVTPEDIAEYYEHAIAAEQAF